MDPNLYSARNGGLSLHQLLEALEEDSEIDAPTEVFIIPPDEKSAETEEDSDDSDQESGNPNRISRGILSQACEIRYNVSDSDSDDADDNIPISRIRETILAASQPSTSTALEANPSLDFPQRKRQKNVNWSDNVPAYNLNQMCTPRQPSVECNSSETPLDFFNLFWDEHIINTIVTQSNIYAQQKNTNLSLCKNELYVIFGAMLMSGYSKCPNKRMYWSNSDDVPKLLYNSMRLNRFETILRNLHFNDNVSNNDNSDKLYKVRPIIDHLKVGYAWQNAR